MQCEIQLGNGQWQQLSPFTGVYQSVLSVWLFVRGNHQSEQYEEVLSRCWLMHCEMAMACGV